MMPDDASLLVRLRDLAERALALRPLDRAEFAALDQQLARARARPVADGVRTIDLHTSVLAQAIARLDDARRIGDERDLELWAQAIGLILPRVRTDLWKAIEQRNARPTP